MTVMHWPLNDFCLGSQVASVKVAGNVIRGEEEQILELRNNLLGGAGGEMDGCIKTTSFVSSIAASHHSAGLRSSEGQSHFSPSMVLRTAQAFRFHRSGLSQAAEATWFFLFCATFP